MKAVILGATGYTGMVLLRILARHPEVTEVLAVSSSQPGAPLIEVDPGLPDAAIRKTQATGSALVTLDTAVAQKPDVVFAALPHLKSAEVCAPFFGVCPVIDLSADFRIKNLEMFRLAYGQDPPRADLLESAVYGLSEWKRDSIRSADLIANPGCYPTTTLLPLLPLVAAGAIGNKIAVTAMSGISGAGRSAKQNNLFVERSENMNAYSPGKSHRHYIEMQTQIDEHRPGYDIIFVPHLVPLKQGMAVTTIVDLKKALTDDEIAAIYSSSYADEPFVRIQRTGIPETRQVRYSNRVDIAWRREGERLILMSVSDNLLKGASGQAVQNMNIRFGFPETAGLEAGGEF